MRASVVATIACAVLGGRASAQQIATLRSGVGAGAAVRTALDSSRPSDLYASFARIPKPLAPVVSAIVPGAGQAMLRQDRFLAYAALEAFVWLQYTKDAHESKVEQRRSVDLALQVARSPFVSPKSAPAGNWDYYETLEHYIESGKYTLVEGQIVPDTTPQTYNAYVWSVARLNHWANPDQPPPRSSPAYQAALDEYARRAARAGYQWSWRDHQLEQDLYRESINKRNDAARRATFDLGIVMANHVLSMVDAFATMRLQSLGGPGHGARLSASIPLPRF